MEDYRLEQSGQEVQNILNGAAMQVDLTAEIDRAQGVEQALDGKIDAEEIRAKAAEKQNADDIDAIEEKIPSGASSSNQLTTKEYVDDSVATNTATFRGTYNLVSDLHLTIDATEQLIATALANTIATADNNDYCYIQVPTSSETPTEIKEIDRYKFNGTAWSFEYKLNNSGFTAAQWAAINSGITSDLVAKLSALPTNAELATLLNGKQDTLTFDNVPTEGSNNPVKSGGVYSAIDDEKGARLNGDAALQQAIEAIRSLIPSAATTENQLADKAFVNLGIATSTATFRGTYNLINDLHLTLDATEQQIATALAGAISTADNNDYCFVQVPTSAETPSEIQEINRYKFNGTAWAFEYTLNNSGFTAAQWAAINSGITSDLVAKLSALPTNAELATLLNGKQDTLTFDNVPTEGSNNPVKSGGVYSAIDDEETRAKDAEKANADDIYAIEEKIPSDASSLNKLATENYVNDKVTTDSATFRGTYNLVSNLGLLPTATHNQIAASLLTAISTADNNDYAFVQIPTSAETPEEIRSIERYKFNGTAWAFEYELNNSGFTTAQWAAINSGITSSLVTKLSNLPTNDELTTLLSGLQSAIGDEETRAKAAEKANADDIDLLEASIEAILLLIPSAASSLNQLADKAFVNSSIATASATFRGTYNLVNDLSLTISATHAQIATALAGAVSGEDNNDYAFVQIPTSDETPTQIAKTERYKYNGTEWEYEYDLNNSGYTAAQWAAINSGITAALVTKLSALPTNADLTTALGVLTDVISAINAKIPSAASSSNKLVDTAAMQSYITQVLDTIDATFNVTSTDGHVTVQITQVNGVITNVAVTTSNIASAADLSLLAGRVTTAEGKISANTEDIAELQDLYNALQQSEPVIIEPTDTWPVANPSTTIIYRVIDRVNTPPQYYSDYMWNGTTMVLMAQYNNAIDDEPTPGSNNLVKSGGVAANIVYDISEANAVGGTLATYADLAAALGVDGANIPASIRKGGMSVKFVCSSDNKYVQYRYMGTAVTGNPNPFLDTANWVVYGDINPIEQELQIIQEALDAQKSYERLLSNTGSVDVSTYGWVMAVDYATSIPVGEKILYTVKSNGATGTFKVVVGLAGQAQGEILYQGEILDGETKSFEYVTEEVSYGLMVQSRGGGTGTTTLDLTVDKCDVESNLDGAVLYTAQTKTDAQKQQARQNIGLGDGTIDDEPTAGSNNLVKSGGVQNKLDDIKEDQDQLSDTVEIIQSALNAKNNVETIISQDVSLAAGGYTYGFVNVQTGIPQGTPMRYIITNDANGTAGTFKITLLLAGQAQGHLLAEEYIGLGETKVYDYITDELSYGLFIQTRTPDMNATTIHAMLQKNYGISSNLDSKLSEELGNNIISSITYGHALRGSGAVEDTGLDPTRYAVTDYIPFGDNSAITCNACITSNVGYKYALYGQDKELISVGAPETNLATINKTDGVEYIRFSIDVMVNLPFACYGTELKEYDDYSKVGGYLPKKIFYCGPSRSIQTLKEGIEIAERTMGSILYVDEGTYDLIEEFGSDYFANATATNNHIGLILKNRIHIIFSPNSKVICNYTGDNEYICTLFSPFNAGEYGFTIENLTLEASRTRYAVHDEKNSKHDQHISHYINCDFYFDNSQNIAWDKKASVIGGGLGSNSEIIIERCRFRCISDTGITTTGIYYHQAESAAARGEAFKSIIRILDNYLEDCRIIFQFRYEYQNAPTVVFVNGNSVPSAGSSGKGYDTDGTAFTYNIIRAWNNDIRN